MQVDGKTQLNLVIGNPVRHSGSPAFHRQEYEARGINAMMLAIENPELATLVNTIKTLSIRLTAVTLPFKTAVLAYADTCSDAVIALQAANTLILNEGKIQAHNTDVVGIEAALTGILLEGKKVLILGAGGSARALGYVLQSKQAHLIWFNRSFEKAQELATLFGGTPVTREEAYAQQVDLIINTTPVGQTPRTEESPLPDFSFNPNQTVFDFIYTPTQTRLLHEAAQAGARCINGLPMFEAQARQQIDLAYGVSNEL